MYIYLLNISLLIGVFFFNFVINHTQKEFAKIWLTKILCMNWTGILFYFLWSQSGENSRKEKRKPNAYYQQWWYCQYKLKSNNIHCLYMFYYFTKFDKFQYTLIASTMINWKKKKKKKGYPTTSLILQDYNFFLNPRTGGYQQNQIPTTQDYKSFTNYWIKI